jgi:hypothetical protein
MLHRLKAEALGNDSSRDGGSSRCRSLLKRAKGEGVAPPSRGRFPLDPKHVITVMGLLRHVCVDDLVRDRCRSCGKRSLISSHGGPTSASALAAMRRTDERNGCLASAG